MSVADRALVIIPTYNEAENIAGALETVLAAAEVDVLVVDDASPDGTGARADTLAAADPRVHVLHRAGKEGLGTAYLAGFAWALARDYAWIIEMDADGSHPAERLPVMLAAARAEPSPALIIGSRWVPGGSVVDWPWHREALSRTANAYVRLVLRLGVRDATAGYRVYAAEILRRIDLGAVHARGYYFQVDMTIRTHDAGFVIREVPIAFRDRILGTSKMNGAIVLEAMLAVTGRALTRLVRRPGVTR